MNSLLERILVFTILSVQLANILLVFFRISWLSLSTIIPGGIFEVHFVSVESLHFFRLFGQYNLIFVM
jgi:hypothetical protein